MHGTGFLMMTLAATGFVPAQSQLELRRGSETTPCVFTTDAANLQISSDNGALISSNLQAAAFSAACGPSAPASPVFQQPLSATPAAAVSEQPVIVRWTVSGADRCITDGTALPAGARLDAWPSSGTLCSGTACNAGSVTATPHGAGDYALVLQCLRTGNPNAAVSRLTLPVGTAGDPTCSAHPPVFPTRQSSITVYYGTHGSASVTTFDQFYDDTAGPPTASFPQQGNRAVGFAQNTRQYVALPFTVPATLSATLAARMGAFETNYIPFAGVNFPANNGISYSVSRCPGDFNVGAACKRQWSGQDGAYLTVSAPEVSDPTGALCKLERGATYYLNVVTGTLAAPGIPQCSAATCAVSLSYFRLQD